MVMVTPLAHAAAPHALGAVGVGSSALTGYELGSTVGTVIAAGVALATLGLSIAASSNRKKGQAELDAKQREKEAREAAESDAAERIEEITARFQAQITDRDQRFRDQMTERDRRIDQLNMDHQRELLDVKGDRDFYRNLYFTATGKAPSPPSEGH